MGQKVSSTPHPQSSSKQLIDNPPLGQTVTNSNELKAQPQGFFKKYKFRYSQIEDQRKALSNSNNPYSLKSVFPCQPCPDHHYNSFHAYFHLTVLSVILAAVGVAIKFSQLLYRYGKNCKWFFKSLGKQLLHFLTPYILTVCAFYCYLEYQNQLQRAQYPARHQPKVVYVIGTLFLLGDIQFTLISLKQWTSRWKVITMSVLTLFQAVILAVYSVQKIRQFNRELTDYNTALAVNLNNGKEILSLVLRLIVGSVLVTMEFIRKPYLEMLEKTHKMIEVQKGMKKKIEGANNNAQINVRNENKPAKKIK